MKSETDFRECMYTYTFSDERYSRNVGLALITYAHPFQSPTKGTCSIRRLIIVLR